MNPGCDFRSIEQNWELPPFLLENGILFYMLSFQEVCLVEFLIKKDVPLDPLNEGYEGFGRP